MFGESRGMRESMPLTGPREVAFRVTSCRLAYLAQITQMTTEFMTLG